MAREYDNIADAISAVNGEVGEQSTKIADILEALKGKAGGDSVDTTWISIGVRDVTVGVNSVSNPVQATAYFEQTVGTGNVIGAFLKTEKAEYVYNELVYMCGELTGTGSSTLTFIGKRYRSGLNDFSPASGYDVRIVEGSIYQVLYFTNHKEVQ